ncbi:response regulator transcription factor [Rhodobacter sp. CZR27]|uniref:response regulator transcription factor n=1 Tax=Rhodobacter sp. CZR27 TaxID=2033869 RepID=UPI000BBE243A|nr:response regulator transcription factor [Rhodobacter sp. CZR27]
MAKILLVEDDPRIANFVTRGLKAEGHALDVAATGQGAMTMMRTAGYALVILDRMLPDFDGVTICRQMRSENIGSRVLMLTARDALGDKIEGLNAGADDYLTKPFAFDELVARIEALLRRAPVTRFDPVLQVADLVLDPTTRQVTRGGRAIALTPKEFGLLRYLMEHSGAVLSRTQILNNNWGYGFDPNSNVVEVYVRYLRTKIDGVDEKPLIHTVRGAGYRLGT